MSRNATLFALLVFAQMVALAGGALAGGDTTVILNTTNACIDSTYKSWTPNMTSPLNILIDRRVNFNPVTGCVTAASNNASCGRDPGSPMLLSASVQLPQVNPYCSWNCAAAGCGTIITDGPNNGLPVELMNFGFEDEEPGDGAAGRRR